MKTCQFCNMTIPDEAHFCPSCGGPAPAVKVETTAAKTNTPQPGVPLYEFKNMVFSLTVYPNRITIIDKQGGTKAMLFPKRTDIAIKSITGINTKGFLKRLQLTMNDGTVRDIPMVMGKDSEKVRDLVLGLI